MLDWLIINKGIFLKCMPMYLLLYGAAGQGYSVCCPGARAPTEGRAAQLSKKGRRSLEGPGATVLRTIYEGRGRKNMGQKSRGRTLPTGFFGLLAPFPHWSVRRNWWENREPPRIWCGSAWEEAKWAPPHPPSPPMGPGASGLP